MSGEGIRRIKGLDAMLLDIASVNLMFQSLKAPVKDNQQVCSHITILILALALTKRAFVVEGFCSLSI